MLGNDVTVLIVILEALYSAIYVLAMCMLWTCTSEPVRATWTAKTWIPGSDGKSLGMQQSLNPHL